MSAIRSTDAATRATLSSLFIQAHVTDNSSHLGSPCKRDRKDEHAWSHSQGSDMMARLICVRRPASPDAVSRNRGERFSIHEVEREPETQPEEKHRSGTQQK